MFSPTEKCKTQASKTKQVVEQSTSLENRDSEMIQEPSSIVGHSNSITPQNRFYHLHHPPPPPPPPPFQAIKSRTTSKVSNAKKAKKIRSQNSSSAAKKIRNMLAQSTTSISLAKKDPSKYAKNSVNSKLKSFESSITAKTKLPTVDLNSSTESNHDTALLLACSNGHDDAVKCLINKGADIEHKNKKGLTPLIVAAANGHVSIIEILLNHGAELESLTDVSKDTALSVACSLGQIKAVELLLCRGANKEHRNISDYTPLSLASAAGHTEIADILCRHGAEINLRTGSKLGITPLMLASMNGHIETVKLLLDRGSDINAYVETNRNTALTLAAFQGRHDVVDLLADRNANIEHRAKTGLTPLMEAASSGYTEVGKVLLEKGAEVNAAPVPATRDTALTLAADKGYAKFVEVLIINGANVDAKNKKGYSALWLACNGGHLDVVNLLIQAKCEVDAQDNRKVSCLMAAFRKGHVKVVKLMVSHVAQFPSDQETNRYIDICSDEELKKKVIACAGIIRFAKDRQAAEALKNATNLLEEIDMERSRQESKKAAAARKRERKKQKKKEKAEQNQQQQQKSHTEIDDNGNFKESNFSTDIEKNEIFKNPQEENDESIKSNNRNEEEDVNPKITIKKSKTLINQNKQSSDTKPTADQNSGTSENEDKTIQKKLQDQSFEKNERSKLKNIKSIVDSGVMKFSISKNRNRDLEISASEKHPKIRIVTDSSTKHQSMIFNDCNHNSSQAGTRRVDQPQSKIRLSFQNKNEKSVESDISHQTNKISDQIVNHMNHAKNSRGTKTFTNKRYEAQMSSNNYSNNPAINKSTAIEFTKRDEGWKEVVRKSKRVLVPGNAISRVIGRSGCNINTIREVSGAHIEVEKQKGQGDRNVIIRGSAEATRIASQLITVLSQEADKDLSEIMENLGISKHPPSAELSPDNSSNEDAFSFSKTVSENSLQVSVAQSVAQKNYRQITSKCFSKSATTNESVANKSSPRSQSLEISTFKDDLNSVTQTSATSNTVSYTMAVNSKIRSTNSSSSTATNMNGNTNVKIMSTIFKPSNKSLLYSNRNPNIRSKQSKETTSNFESSVESHNYNYNLVSEKNFTSEIDGKHSAGAASIQSNEFDASMSLNESLDQFANEKNRFSDVTASGIITSTSSVNTITHLLMQQLSQPILSNNQNLSSKSTDDNETLRSLVSPIYSAHSNSSQPSCPTSSLLINTSSTSTANHIVSNLNYSGHVRSAPCTPPISNYSPSIKSNLNQASNLLNERISPFSINPNLLMKSTTNSLDNHESVATAAATEYGPIHPSMFASSTSSNTDFLVNNSDLLYNNNQLRNQINNMGDANHNLFLDQRSLTPTLFNSEASNNLKRSGLNPNAPDYASRSNSFSAIPPQHSLGPGGTINFNQSNMNYSNSVSSFTLNTMINGLSCTGQNRSNYSPNNNPPPMSNDVRQMILNYSMNIFQNNVPKQHQEAAARLAHLSAQNNNFAVNNDHLHGNVFASKPISKKLNYFPYVAPNEMKSSQLNSLDSFSMQTQLINNQNQFKLAAANNTSCIGPTSSVNTELFDFFNSTQNTYDLTMKTPPSLDSPDSRQEDGNAKINKQPAPIGTERAQRKHPASCGQMSTTPNTINNDNPMFMDQTNSWRLNYDDVNEAVNGESNLNQSSLSFNASLNDTSNFADPIFPSATDQSLSGFYNPMSFANQQQQQPQQKCGIKLLNEALTNLDHFNSMSDNIILNSGDISANHLNDWQTDPIVLKTNNNLIVPSIPTHPLSVSGTNEFDSYKMWGSNNWSNQI
ncbi:Ankyrin repeat and KH domain-containing protein [Sarcoptes scabiei]|uniref:Ankyrin repeat and KH domain-containing protein n=1 Tax=Sarcoptes scabiei TaxID=52283 RepID=A0A131ZUR4_SARSC|nr:Ankyrin repeat and KH domain-containing protein [Sarcoptes scabiei]